MSLINEALKKAQRQRLEEGADPTATSPAAATSGHVARRGKGQGSNTVVLLGSGALVLVVLSVVFTVYLVNRPTDTKRVAAATPTATIPVKSAATSSPTTPAPAETAPAIVVPKLTPANPPPVTTPVTAPGSPAVATSATPATQSAPTAPPPATATATPSTTATSVVTTPATQPASAISPPAATPTVAPAPSPAAALPAGVPDERVAAFVDSVRVTGIRSSGAESRVLMNERVYRVNDVVERNLGVRLVKAAADSLTFSDPRGVTYVKNF
jgi:hypothetical protein